MSLEELDRLRAFLEKDNWINSLADFQRVTGVSDSLLKEISPYFKFPDWVNKTKTLSKEKGRTARASIVKKDINQATATDLRGVYGIGEVFPTGL